MISQDKNLYFKLFFFKFFLKTYYFNKCAEFSSFACLINDFKTKLSKKEVDNDLNDRYYEKLDFENEKIEFYKYAKSFIKTSRASLNNNANIASNQIESQQSREYYRQRIVKNNNRKNDEIVNEFNDNEFDHVVFERNKTNTHDKVIKKTRKHFNEIHRVILKIVYRQNLLLHKTTQAKIAKELKLEKYRVYVCSFIETLFSHVNNCCSIKMIRKSTSKNSYDCDVIV